MKFQEASTAWWDRQLRRGRITAAWNVMEGIMSKGRFSAIFVAAVAGISVYGHSGSPLRCQHRLVFMKPV
jgi:hypothetical protein